MVDTDDTRRTTNDGQRTTPRVWYKLPTGELIIITLILKVSKIIGSCVITSITSTLCMGVGCGNRALLVPWIKQFRDRR